MSVTPTHVLATHTGAIVLDGKAIAAKVRATVAVCAADFSARCGRRPGLAVVQVGEDPASSVYVRNKRRSSTEVGIESFAFDLPITTGEAEVLALVERLNRDRAGKSAEEEDL